MAPSRRKFVNTGKLNKATELITKANATQSPFFSQLSPEIRNRIYELVLGGYHLHISTYDKNLSQVYACEAEQTDVDFAKASTEKTLTHRSSSSADDPDRHKKCSETRMSMWRPPSDRSSRDKAAGQLDLSVLLVSRQIHQEAALIPFTKNTFLCSMYGAPQRFVRDLLSRPSRALANVVIYHQWMYSLGPQHYFSSVILSKLPGVKRVTIMTTVRVLKTHGMMAASPRSSPRLHEFKDSLKEVQSALHGRELVRLTISVAGRFEKDVDRDIAQKLLEPYHSAARETEQAILQSRNEKS